MSEQQIQESYYQSGIAQMQEEIQSLRANLAAAIKERDETRADYAMLRGVARLCLGENASEKSAQDLFVLVTTDSHPGEAINIRFNRMNAVVEAARALDGNGTTDAAWERLWAALEAMEGHTNV